MGRDKAWIEFQSRALIEQVVERLSQVTQEIIIVTNQPEPFKKFDAALVSDAFPGKGSLGGIYSGLRAARFERAVVVACDMPFLNPALLNYLIVLSPEYDVVIPSARDWFEREKKASGRATAKDTNLHPLHAIYSKECLAPIQTRLREGDLRMISFHHDVRVRIVNESEIERFDPQHLSFFNANTPEELARAAQLVATGVTQN